MSENVPRNMCAHRRFGSDCADGQADKSLCGCKSIRTFSHNATYTCAETQRNVQNAMHEKAKVRTSLLTGAAWSAPFSIQTDII